MILQKFQFLFIALIFILADCITGSLKAMKEKGFTSTGLKRGGFNKLGEILAMLLCYLIDAALPVAGISIGVSFAPVVCTYLLLMEIVSNYENLCVLCPILKNTPVSKYFGKIKDMTDEKGEDNGTSDT